MSFNRSMGFNRGIRHLTVRAEILLPFFDSIYGAVLTLLAFDVPSMLDMSGQYQKLFMPILAYCLTGLIVILYWFKLRQLIEFSRVLTLLQLVLIFLGLLTVVLLPKMTELVLNYGGGSDSLSHWTLSQAVNVNFLVALFLVDGSPFCLLFRCGVTDSY